jgi:hypothetical protein
MSLPGLIDRILLLLGMNISFTRRYYWNHLRQHYGPYLLVVRLDQWNDVLASEEVLRSCWEEG